MVPRGRLLGSQQERGNSLPPRQYHRDRGAGPITSSRNGPTWHRRPMHDHTCLVARFLPPRSRGPGRRPSHGSSIEFRCIGAAVAALVGPIPSWSVEVRSSPDLSFTFPDVRHSSHWQTSASSSNIFHLPLQNALPGKCTARSGLVQKMPANSCATAQTLIPKEVMDVV